MESAPRRPDSIMQPASNAGAVEQKAGLQTGHLTASAEATTATPAHGRLFVWEGDDERQAMPLLRSR